MRKDVEIRCSKKENKNNVVVFRREMSNKTNLENHAHLFTPMKNTGDNLIVFRKARKQIRKKRRMANSRVWSVLYQNIPASILVENMIYILITYQYEFIKLILMEFAKSSELKITLTMFVIAAITTLFGLFNKDKAKAFATLIAKRLIKEKAPTV